LPLFSNAAATVGTMCSAPIGASKPERRMTGSGCSLTLAGTRPMSRRVTLMGVISFYDVAKTVVEAQDFENRMLKACIRDWPEADGDSSAGAEPGASRPV
jgi:hypothetical protein